LSAKKSLSKLNSVERSETISEPDSNSTHKNKLETKDSLDLESGVSVRTEESTEYTAITSCTTTGSTASSGRGTVSSGRGTCHTAELLTADGPLNSASSNKEMSLASVSPPPDLYRPGGLTDLDLMDTNGAETISDIDQTIEFTKVTKKKGKKKERSNRLTTGSAFSEENRSRGEEGEVRRASNHTTQQQKEAEDWTFRGYNRIRGSGEAITATKSTCSVPPSDASDTDDHDSVHSLPVGSTRAKVSAPTHSVSSGHTPQASYADIARHAAALYTQQAGQQQHAVYREHLQYREYTPGNTKESVSSTEGESLSEEPEPQPHEDTPPTASENAANMRHVSPPADPHQTDNNSLTVLIKDEYPPLTSDEPQISGGGGAVVTKDVPNTTTTTEKLSSVSNKNVVVTNTTTTTVVKCQNCSSQQQIQQQQSSDITTQLPLNTTTTTTSDNNTKPQQSTTTPSLPTTPSSQVKPNKEIKLSDINTNNTTKLNNQPCETNGKSAAGKQATPPPPPPVVILPAKNDTNLDKQPSATAAAAAVGSLSDEEIESGFSFGFDLNPELLARTATAAAGSSVVGDDLEDNDDVVISSDVNCATNRSRSVSRQSGTSCDSDTVSATSPVQKSINQSESSLSQSTATLCAATSVESVTMIKDSSSINNHIQNEDPDYDSSEEPWYKEVGVESWCKDAAWCQELEQSWVATGSSDVDIKTNHRNFNYDVIVDFVKQAWDSVNCEISTTSAASVAFYQV